MERNIDDCKKQYKDIGKSLEKVYDIYDYFSEDALIYLEDKIKILQNIDDNEKRDFEHYKHFEEIIETIKIFKENGFYDERYFNKIETTKDNIIDKFLELVSSGDYNSAYNLCRKKEYNIEADKRKKSLIFKIYEKLLTYLKYIMVKNRIKNGSKFSDNKDLESALENDNYINAFEMCLNNPVYQDSKNLALLVLLSSVEMQEEKKLLQTIDNSFNNADIDSIRKSLEKYEKFINDKNLKRDTSYYNNRLSAMKKTLESGNYENLKYLYNKAFTEFQNEKYDEALKTIEEFILIDRNTNPKGYILKGKIEESLKEFYKARKSYQQSIKIFIDPTACLRLGKMFFYTNKYEEALKYFLMYESFRPKKNINNIKFLIMTYKKLRNDVKTVEYGIALNRLRVK